MEGRIEMNLQPKERACLAIMLDLAAPPGEVASACSALARLLRGRKASLGEVLDKDGASQPAPIINEASWGLFRMTFGKYQGEMLADISLKDFAYLTFLRSWIRSVPDKSRNLRTHLEAIERYLGT
jgi:hypothetical protein